LAGFGKFSALPRAALYLLWGSWPMMGVVLASWANDEAVDYGSDWLKAWWKGPS
jgi:hypothetical protein